MKNLSLVLNIVLLVAVAVLFFLHFSGPKASTSAAGESVAPGDLKIAYINSDTVLKYYDYLKVSKEKLEVKTKQMDQEYRSRAMGLQNEIQAYQRNVNSMTLGQVRSTEEELGKKQQNLQLYQQNLQQQLMEEEAKLNKELYDRVTVFLNKYADEKGLQTVLKYDPTSDVLYVSKALDISKDVIDGLNTEYQTEKNGGVPKTDSAASKK